MARRGTHFTCFTGTKVQILTHCRKPPAVYRSAFERKALGGARGRTLGLHMADDFGSVMHESPHMHALQSRSPSPLVYPNLAAGSPFANTTEEAQSQLDAERGLLYWLYWYNSTHTDVLLSRGGGVAARH